MITVEVTASNICIATSIFHSVLTKCAPWAPGRKAPFARIAACAKLVTFRIAVSDRCVWESPGAAKKLARSLAGAASTTNAFVAWVGPGLFAWHATQMLWHSLSSVAPATKYNCASTHYCGVSESLLSLASVESCIWHLVEDWRLLFIQTVRQELTENNNKCALDSSC